MTLIENVVGTILIMFFFLIAGMIITVNITTQTHENIETKELSFFDEQIANNLNSILLVTERNTKNTMANLLGSALYYRDTNIIYQNTTVDIREEFEELLDATYGKGKYYVVVRPQIKEIGIHFIIDGSPSLDDERLELSKRMKVVAEEAMKGGRTVEIQVYMLKNDDNICDLFNPQFFEKLRNELDGNISEESNCNAIDGENFAGDLYYDSSIHGEEDYRIQHGIISPYNNKPTDYNYTFKQDFDSYNSTHWQTRDIDFATRKFSWLNANFKVWVANKTSFLGAYAYGAGINLKNYSVNGTSTAQGYLTIGGKNYRGQNTNHRNFWRYNVAVQENTEYAVRNYPKFELDFWLDSPNTRAYILTANSLRITNNHNVNYLHGLHINAGSIDAITRTLGSPHKIIPKENLSVGTVYHLIVQYTSTGSVLSVYDKNDPGNIYTHTYAHINSEWKPRFYFAAINDTINIDNVKVSVQYGDTFVTTRDPAEFYESDWASGAAYASYKAREFKFSKINILFPMSEELASSSKPHECIVNSNLQTNTSNVITKRFYCDTCISSCDSNSSILTETESRSLTMVNRALTYIDSNQHIVDPIIAKGCNYKSDENISWWDRRNQAWDYYRRDILKEGFFYGGVPPSGTSYCEDDICGGCSIDQDFSGPQSEYRLHSCFQLDCQLYELRRQMGLMANSTQGQLIELDDLAALSYKVKESINSNLDSLRIEFGERKDLERHSFKRVVPLPEKGFADLFLWIYKDGAGNYSEDGFELT